jgi:hypothetical protein
MSCLSSPGINRQLVLLCIRLLVQGLMALSMPHTGVDNVHPKNVQTGKMQMPAIPARDPRFVCLSPRRPADASSRTRTMSVRSS